MRRKDDIQKVAAALERPRAGYVQRLERARQQIGIRHGEASRQLGSFADRIRDLTTDELCELHDETFRGETAAVFEVVTRLVHIRTDCATAGAALSVLAPVLDRLEAERNPYAYAVRSLCCLLLVRLNPSSVQQSMC